MCNTFQNLKDKNVLRMKLTFLENKYDFKDCDLGRVPWLMLWYKVKF